MWCQVDTGLLYAVCESSLVIGVGPFYAGVLAVQQKKKTSLHNTLKGLSRDCVENRRLDAQPLWQQTALCPATGACRLPAGHSLPTPAREGGVRWGVRVREPRLLIREPLLVHFSFLFCSDNHKLSFYYGAIVAALLSSINRAGSATPHSRRKTICLKQSVND